jgi:hypothetical protein
MLAVGKPMVRPSFLPSMTRPAMTKARPSSSLGVFDVAGGQRLAHRRTGNPDAAEINGVHGLDHEAVLLPGTLQQGEIAAARLAEAEVVADDQVPHRKAAHQDLLDELLARQRSQLAVEAADMHAIDAGLGQQFDLVAQAGQPRRRLLGGEQFARMRLEGEHRRRQGEFARLGRQFGKQGTMAAMHAIEVADGQHRGRRRPLGNTAKNQHGN